MPRKPVPKKRTAPARKQTVGYKTFLGEEDASSSDSEIEHETTFQSAELDANATDYQLEYTNIGRVETRLSPQKRRAAQTRGIAVPRPSTSKYVQGRAPTSKSIIVSHHEYEDESDSESTEESTEQHSNTGTQPPPKQRPHGTNRAPAAKPARKPRKNPNPQHRVWKEIRRLQKTTNMLIPRLCFSRVVKEVFMDSSTTPLRITVAALEALQEAAEMYLVQLFQDANMCTLHRVRKTLMIKDMELTKFIRGRKDPGNL